MTGRLIAAAMLAVATSLTVHWLGAPPALGVVDGFAVSAAYFYARTAGR